MFTLNRGKVVVPFTIVPCIFLETIGSCEKAVIE
jgi:hypothetical protein